MIDYSADVEEVAEPAGDSLARVIKLANQMVTEGREVARLEAELRDAKAALERTQTETLPDLMTELGVPLLKLPDGSVVEVKKDVQCGISEANRAAAHAWLNANGFGGLIKTQVITEFGRGELERAATYVREANAQFPDNPAGVKETVHPMTLKSFVKEQLEKAAPIPLETFGIRPYNRATYKAAR